MKYRVKRRQRKALSLDAESFAVLTDFTDGKSVYQFSYSINTARALDQGALNVKIDVIPSDQPKPPSIFTLNALSSKPSPVLLAKNIQQITAVKKDTKNANVNAQFGFALSDFTTKVSNVSPFGSFKKKKFKLALAPAIAQQSQMEPILKVNNFPSASIVQSVKSLAIKSILQDAEDPSNVQVPFSIGTQNAIQGMIGPAQAALKLKTFSKKLVQKTLQQANATNSSQAAETAVIPIVAQEDTNFATVTKEMSFEVGDLNNAADFIVQFSLIGKSGLVVEKVRRTVEHAQNIKVIQTPINPPTITSMTLPARNLLTITQNDPLATSVDVYRRVFSRTQRIEEHNYVFVANVPVTKAGGPVPFEDLIGNASDIIYRVIPKGKQQQVGAAYTNKVVKAFKFGIPRERTPRLLYAGIVAQSTSQGVRIEVLGLAPGVAAIKLLAKDRTRRDTSFRAVPSFIGKNETILVNDTEQVYSFLDAEAKQNNVIEYAVMMLFENGDEEISISREVYKNTPFSSGIVDTVVSQPRLFQTRNGVDVQFNITSTVNSSNISQLKELLEQQGQADLFSDELLEEKASLNNLLAHQIRRIDLTTGKTDFFRVFTGTSFSDERNRKIDDISPPVPGRTYRYVVSALLRAPETLFERNYQTITNSAGIAVKVLPLKFKHPIVSQYGNIVTPASLLVNHSETQFEFGNVGNFVVQDVSIDVARPQVFNARVTRFNKDTNILRWNVTGEKKLLDHFLVLVERFGDEEIIGRVHTNFNSNIIEFIDKETPKEPGSYRYKVIPVLKDYSQAPAEITQEII